MKASISAILSTRLLDRKGHHRKQVLDAWNLHCDHDHFESDKSELYQSARLAKLLQYACAHVDRYKALHINVADIRNDNAFDVLKMMPLINRTDIQQNMKVFIGRNDNIIIDSTGGSTGTPMNFYVDRATQIAREGSLLWANSLTGWARGERIGMLWGSDRDVCSALRSSRLALRWWIENRRWYNAFNMGPDRMLHFHNRMEKFKPHIIVAYAGAIFEFARFLHSKGIAPHYPLKAIVSSAEVLTDAMRLIIEDVFSVSVYNRYGNREMGAIAAECSAHSGLHINEYDMIVEIDSVDPYAIPGPIIATYLVNYAMPFIRYNTGDIGCFIENDPCPCGRKTKRINSKILGRSSDTIKTKAGRLIHGEFFTHLFYGSSDVIRFRFTQITYEQYHLELVLKSSNDSAEWRKKEENWQYILHRELGPKVEIQIDYIDNLPSKGSGKHQFVRSLI